MNTVAPALRFSLLLLCATAQGVDLRAADKALENAVALFNSHHVDEARPLLAVIVDREPDNTQALWYLGKANLLMQRREEAAAFLERAVKLSPLDPRILADYSTACLLRASDLGVSFKSIGYARRGRDALLKAVQLAPDKISYREGLVAFYRKAPGIVGGSMAKAYAQAEEIIKRDPVRGAILQATVQAEDKKYDEARAACEKALRLQPDSYLALYTLGRIASESGQELPRGEQALRHCLELTPTIQEPDFAGVHYRLGLIAEKGGRLDVARSEYQISVKMDPTFEPASTALARVTK
ncbi:MAG: tetratricopeptide repeat protein [Opitutaceae bacterium]|jgi:tetratricopeptide (TPR) repeat protein